MATDRDYNALYEAYKRLESQNGIMREVFLQIIGFVNEINTSMNSIQVAVDRVTSCIHKSHEIFSRSIDKLDLSIRSWNALRNAEITDIFLLVQLKENELHKRKIKSLGSVSIKEIKYVLSEIGLCLDMTKEDIHYWIPPVNHD